MKISVNPTRNYSPQLENYQWRIIINALDEKREKIKAELNELKNYPDERPLLQSMIDDIDEIRITITEN